MRHHKMGREEGKTGKLRERRKYNVAKARTLRGNAVILQPQNIPLSAFGLEKTSAQSMRELPYGVGRTYT